MLNNVTFSARTSNIGMVRFGQKNESVLSDDEKSAVKDLRDHASGICESTVSPSIYASRIWKLVEGLSRREQNAPETVATYRELVKSQLYYSSTWDEIERLNRTKSPEEIQEINTRMSRDFNLDMWTLQPKS